jgi:hypothetical protein
VQEGRGRWRPPRSRGAILCTAERTRLQGQGYLARQDLQLPKIQRPAPPHWSSNFTRSLRLALLLSLMPPCLQWIRLLRSSTRQWPPKGLPTATHRVRTESASVKDVTARRVTTGTAGGNRTAESTEGAVVVGAVNPFNTAAMRIRKEVWGVRNMSKCWTSPHCASLTKQPRATRPTGPE